MKIRVITGEENAPVCDAVCPNFGGRQMFLPEETYKHPSRISREIIDKCQRFFDEGCNLTIVTYSTVVLNSVILWAVNVGHYNVVELIGVFKNGEKVLSFLGRCGDYDESIRKIIDIDASIKTKIFDLIIDKYY